MDVNKISFLQQSILSLYNLSQVNDVIFFTLGTVLKFIKAESLSLLYFDKAHADFSFYWKHPGSGQLEALALQFSDLDEDMDIAAHHPVAVHLAFVELAKPAAQADEMINNSRFFQIRKEAEEIGSLQIVKGEHELSEKEEQFLLTFLAHTAQAISLIWQQQQMTQEISKTSTVANFNDILFGASDVSQACDLVVNMVSSILRVNRVSFLLAEPGADLMNVIAGKGLERDLLEKPQNDQPMLVIDEVVKNRRPLLITDIEKFFPIRNRPYYYNHSFIAYPVIHRNRILGVLNVSNKIDRSLFTHEDLARMSELMPYVARSLYTMVSTAELNQLAITDELSQLHNRRYFYRRLNEEFNRAIRYNGNFSIIIADFDKLKEINDVHGHLMGDKVIQVVGELIKKTVRDIDCAARYGGDEFIIACPKADSRQARILAERIRETVAQHVIEYDDKKINVSISSGVASFPEDDTEVNGLVKKADEALYQAKALGGNCTSLYNIQSQEDLNQIVDKFSLQVINTPLKVRIVSFFERNPMALHHTGDLASILKIAANWLRSELEDLAKAGILERITIHDLDYYSFSKDEHLIKLCHHYLHNSLKGEQKSEEVEEELVSRRQHGA